MAATGHFGHRAHATGNLTALVAQLFREQRQEEDRVMFDAYQNGGKGLNGKPVTDQVMRSYIAQRRNEFTKDDPTYSEWNNRLIQLDFKIGEEKVQLAYKQGHVGPGAVAAYYRHQLNSIPRDSAFYRDVAGRAADWAKAATGAARSAARGRLTKALDAKWTAAGQKFASYGQIEGILTEAAKRAGLIAGNQTLTDADATDLQAFLQRGVPGPKGTTITFDDWRNAAVSAYKAIDTQIAVAKQLGRTTKDLTTAKNKFLNQNLVRINTIDDRAKYELARDTFQQAVVAAGFDPNWNGKGNPPGDPRALIAAAKQLADTLTNIGEAASRGSGLTNENDPEFIGGINNEITALTTGKVTGFTVTDLQRTSTEAVSGSDAESQAASLVAAQAAVEALDTGKAIFGQDGYGGPLRVIPLPPSGQLDPTGRHGLDDSYQPSITLVNGVPTAVMLKGLPVQAISLKDKNNNPVQTINGIPVADLTKDELQAVLREGYSFAKDKPQTIGYIFQQGDTKTYGVKQPDGSLAFTSTNPFGSGNVTNDAVEILAPSTVNDAGDAITVPPVIKTDPNDTTGFLADSSVSPKDLRALATTADQQTAAQLIELANTRDERARAQLSNTREDRGPTSPQQQMVQTVSDAFQGLTNTVATIFGPRQQNMNGQTAYTPPALPALAPVSQVAPPTFQHAAQTLPAPTAAPAPPKLTGTSVSTGKTIDDLTQNGSSGGAVVGGASSDLIDKYLHPAPPAPTSHPGAKPA